MEIMTRSTEIKNIEALATKHFHCIYWYVISNGKVQ